MPRIRLGIVLESLNLPLRAALARASALGAAGVQVDAVGELSPDRLTQTGRKDFRHLLKSLGLELTSLGCPLRHGFDEPNQLDARVAHTQKVLTLAYELGPRIVTVFPGAIPDGPDHPGRAILQDSLTQVGRHADRVGAFLALDNGSEPPSALGDFLGRFDIGGLAVNFDTATALVSGFDPADGLRELHPYLRLVTARDARKGRGGRAGQEVAMGHGDIDWTRVLAALEEVGYAGGLVIRRGPCPDPVGEMAHAVAFFKRLVG